MNGKKMFYALKFKWRICCRKCSKNVCVACGLPTNDKSILVRRVKLIDKFRFFYHEKINLCAECNAQIN